MITKDAEKESLIDEIVDFRIPLYRLAISGKIKLEPEVNKEAHILIKKLTHKSTDDLKRLKRWEEEKIKPVWRKSGADDVNYEYWCKKDCWSIDEGVALLLGKNPKIVTYNDVRFKLPSSDADFKFTRQYDEIRELALRSLMAKRLNEFNTPQYFIEWAREKDISIPNDLEMNILSNSNRDAELQRDANILAARWKEEGRLNFSLRNIAETLSVTDKWNEMTAIRIERIIKKAW